MNYYDLCAYIYITCKLFHKINYLAHQFVILYEYVFTYLFKQKIRYEKFVDADGYPINDKFVCLLNIVATT